MNMDPQSSEGADHDRWNYNCHSNNYLGHYPRLHNCSSQSGQKSWEAYKKTGSENESNVGKNGD